MFEDVVEVFVVMALPMSGGAKAFRRSLPS